MRHVANISGKDSLVMGLLLLEREPELPMEYVFVDTGIEHPTTYEFLEAAKELIPGLLTLHPTHSFEELLTRWNGFLPSAVSRWCTKELKINAVSRYIGNSQVTLYIGLRADEEGRIGALTRTNEVARYPLREYGVTLPEVLETIRRLKLPLPQRRGCYLCWGQKRWEWVKLGEDYPELFAKAVEYERLSQANSNNFTFIRGLPLTELWDRRESILSRASSKLGHPVEEGGENDDGDSVCRVWCK